MKDQCAELHSTNKNLLGHLRTALWNAFEILYYEHMKLSKWALTLNWLNRRKSWPTKIGAATYRKLSLSLIKIRHLLHDIEVI